MLACSNGVPWRCFIRYRISPLLSSSRPASANSRASAPQVLTFAAATIGVLRTVQKYDMKLTKHHDAAMRYKDIATDIQRYRATEMRDLEAFVDKICDLLDAHDQSATSISESYVDEAKEGLSNLPHTDSEN